MASFVTKERICVNADMSAVVPCDSPQAAFQLVPAGGMVSAEDARKYGLSSPAEPDTKAVDKDADDVEDKAVHKAENKTAKSKG